MIGVSAPCHWSCDTCRASAYIDLPKLAESLGPDFSLIDKLCRCREPKCDGIVRFFSAPGQGCWSYWMVSDEGRRRYAGLTDARWRRRNGLPA